ncbi:MAG: energy transducer TonB [Deltaproteobacteria bacterium]|nr:energy transducer TonB [Deltaproteobacteria bacterium]
MNTTAAMPPSLNPRNAPANKALVLFFALSALAHLSVLLVMSVGLFPAGFFRTQAQGLREDDSMIVDVVDLPPTKPEKKATGNRPTRHAQRNQHVDKETFPDGNAASRRRTGTGVDIGKAQQVQTPQSVKKSAPTPDVHKSGALGDAVENPFAAPSAPPAQSEAKASRPELFPSSEALTALEKRYATESPKGEKGKTLQLNTSELKYQRYLLGMKNRIEGRWGYPELAVRNGWQGSLYISFVIRKDGSVSDIKLEKSSNYPVLDDAAITAVRLATPLPPFPENFDIEDISIKGHFVYDLLEAPRER